MFFRLWIGLIFHLIVQKDTTHVVIGWIMLPLYVIMHWSPLPSEHIFQSCYSDLLISCASSSFKHDLTFVPFTKAIGFVLLPTIEIIS